LSAPQIEQLKQQKDQLQELNNLAKDPQKLKDKVDSIKRDLQNRLDAQKREAEDRAKTEAVKQGLRTGLSSLMLAIGYGTIGALGWLNRGGNIARPKTGARL
jgi:chromosome segregation ATPase